MKVSTKHLKKKTQGILLASSMIFLTSCASGPKFHPDFYKADSKTQSIVNEEGKRVKCSQPEFNNYACQSKQKIKELSDVFRPSRRVSKWEK